MIRTFLLQLLNMFLIKKKSNIFLIPDSFTVLVDSDKLQEMECLARALSSVVLEEHLLPKMRTKTHLVQWGIWQTQVLNQQVRFTTFFLFAIEPIVLKTSSSKLLFYFR